VDPLRSPDQELASFEYQQQRFVKVSPPPKEEQERVIQALLDVTKTAVQPDEYSKDLVRDALQHVQTDASPGFPLMVKYRTNKDWLESPEMVDQVVDHVDSVIRVVLEGKSDWRGKNSRQLVEAGLVAPIRLFIKNEFHSREKALSKRWRLISSPSVIDQLIDRVAFGRQNAIEIASFTTSPVKCGLSLNDDDSLLKSVYSYAQEKKCTMHSDMSGWDQSVQDWDLDMEAEYRCRKTSRPWLQELVRFRVHCIKNTLYVLSNGKCLEGHIGQMKSGWYNTSIGNSHIRFFNALLAGSTWAITQGDDCLESTTLPVDQLRERYLSLGKRLKECDDRFIFCSHSMGGSPFKARPLGVIKMALGCAYKAHSEAQLWEAVFGCIVSLKYREETQQFLEVLAHGVGSVKEFLEKTKDLTYAEIKDKSARQAIIAYKQSIGSGPVQADQDPEDPCVQ
jgi:hypothetical protein